MSKDLEGIYSMDGGTTWATVIGVSRPDRLADQWGCVMQPDVIAKSKAIDSNIYLASPNLKYLFSIREKQ